MTLIKFATKEANSKIQSTIENLNSLSSFKNAGKKMSKTEKYNSAFRVSQELCNVLKHLPQNRLTK